MSNFRRQLGEICEVIKSNSSRTVQNTGLIGKYKYFFFLNEIYTISCIPLEIDLSKKLSLLKVTKLKYTCLHLQYC